MNSPKNQESVIHDQLYPLLSIYCGTHIAAPTLRHPHCGTHIAASHCGTHIAALTLRHHIAAPNFELTHYHLYMIIKPSSSKYAFALTIEQTMNNLDALKLSDYPRFLKTIQLGKDLQQLAKNQEIESFAKLAQVHPFELPFLRLEIQDAFLAALSLRSDEMTTHFLQNGFSLDSIPDCLLSVCYSLEYLSPKQAPIELLTSLLQYGANPRIADEKQASTPLHLAATFGNKQFAQKLVEYGADVNAVDLNRMTPLGLAISNKKEKVGEFLRQHGGVIDYKEIK